LSNSQNESGHTQVDKGSLKECLSWLIVIIFATYLHGAVMSRNTDASFPYFDAFTTCASLLSQ
jgi:nicotinamide mononucleotide transporter